MKRPWSYGDDVAEPDRESYKSHRKLYVKMDDRRGPVGVDRLTDSSSGSGLAYDRRRSGDGRPGRSKNGFALRRGFCPKGFRSERTRNCSSWRELRADALDCTDSRETNSTDSIGMDCRDSIGDELNCRDSTGDELNCRDSIGMDSTDCRDSKQNELNCRDSRDCRDSRGMEWRDSRGKDCREEREGKRERGSEKEEGEIEESEGLEEKEESFERNNGCDLKRNSEEIGGSLGEGEGVNVEKKDEIQMEKEEKEKEMPAGNEIEMEKEREEMPSESEIQTEKREEKEEGSGDKEDERVSERENERESERDIERESERISERDIEREDERESERTSERDIERENERERSSNGETETRQETETERNDKPLLSYKDKGKGLALDGLGFRPQTLNIDNSMEISSSKPVFDFDLLLFKPQSSKQYSSVRTKTGTEKEDLKSFSLDLSLSLPGISSNFQNPKNSSENHEGSVKSRFLFQPIQTKTLIPEENSVRIGNPNSSSQTLILENSVRIGNPNSSSQTLIPENCGRIGNPNSSSQTLISENSVRVGNPHSSSQILISENCVQIGSPNSFSQTQISETYVQIANPNSSSQTLISRNPSFSSVTGNRTSVIEKVLYKIANEPLHLSGRMLLEMTENSINYMKNAICEILSNSEKKKQINSLRHALQSRFDLTTANLLKCPRPLLEILTVLKTGRPDFIRNNNSDNNNNNATSDLVEILLDRKCRNSECRNIIQNCGCKICISNSGFCSECMCVICRDFDSASNTCSWVGCDLCMHWCHTDCALNRSLIKPGIQIPDLKPAIQILDLKDLKPGIGIRDMEGKEMQYLCEGCGHWSEMFGFVKEVFKTCCKVWKIEVLVKELGFVRRIFERSEGFRERKLRDLAGKMIEMLGNDRNNHAQVVSYVLGFLSDAESNTNNGIISTIPPSKDQYVNISGTKENPNSNAWLLNNKNPNFDVPEQKPIPILDDLDRLIKLKKTEAKMYKEKSIDAKKEAEGLRRIIFAKNKRIDEEYHDKINQVNLVEFEERRKRKFDEFRALEKEYKMFFGVKIGMESEIRDLMVKLEGAKHNIKLYENNEMD